MPKSFTALLAAWNALSFGRRLGVLIGLGMVLRVVWALAIPVVPESDSYVYWITAGNLANHGVFGMAPDQPFAYWPVGASAIYAVFFKIFGVNFFTVVLVNLLAGGLLMFTSATLARRWFGDREALITAALLALWPSLILYSTVIASEVLFALMVNAALLAWPSRNQPALGAGLLSGISFAAAALIRPVALLIPVVVAIMTAARDRAIGPQALRLAIIMIAMFAAIAPWTARNHAVFDEFVLISTNGGPVLWMGNNPNSSGAYMAYPENVEGLNEVERAEIMGDEAKAYMLSHPVRTATMFVRKLADTHIRETIAVHWNKTGIEKRLGARAVAPLKLVTQAYWILVLLASIAGAGLILRAALQQKTLAAKAFAIMSPPLGLWSYYAVVHAIIISGDRYHMQSVPFIAMLAALAASALIARLHGEKTSLPMWRSEGA